MFYLIKLRKSTRHQLQFGEDFGFALSAFHHYDQCVSVLSDIYGDVLRFGKQN